ncbi:hypothetical protein FSP39_000652 [Pinctada imbricata]|uniref:Uncharacterized protein n=1 Tax=Pinctada imbricata TaxID=66713 RepID=A0AA89BPC0_PINIB|nr:hypothetical protein FSP39_000652 [Pinctada imbricata]
MDICIGDDSPGFDIFYGTSNVEEIEDHPVKFENPLPDWLKGTLIRNSPGRFEVGKRNFTNLFDGFAKGLSWKFQGNGQALFSAKFLRTDSYNASMEKNDIAEYLTIGAGAAAIFY